MLQTITAGDAITSGVNKGDKSFKEGIQLGYSTILSMYGFQLLQGNLATALKEPYSDMITEQTAIKYFGEKGCGRRKLNHSKFFRRQKGVCCYRRNKKYSVINLNQNNNNTTFIPANTYQYFGRNGLEDRNNTSIPPYIELIEGANPASLDKAINHLVQTHASDGVKANLKIHALPLMEYYLLKIMLW